MNVLKTSTGEFLHAAATAALREGAEETIKKAVSNFEKVVRERVYDEVSKLAVKYVESMTNSDPLLRSLSIVIDDRREKR